MATARRLRIQGSGRTASGPLVVTRPLTAAGWVLATDDVGWDLWWGNRVPPDHVYHLVDSTRWVNHIPGIGALTRKDRLAQEMAWSLERNANRPGSAREPWVPETYVLPEGRAGLLDHARRDPAARWVAKPNAGARGEGVTLVQDVAAAARLGNGWLVQRYISNPHLLDGHKYTLRVYVAITSVTPLLVHVFDEGFAKFASRPYPTDPTDRRRFAHLTNPDVLRADTETPTSSQNLIWSQYRALLRAQGHDDALLTSRLHSLVATTVASVREALCASLSVRTEHPARCFELLGFDVALDSDLRPWLIECNLAPSLSIEADPTSPAAAMEATVKSQLVSDLFELVGITGPAPPLQSTRTGGWRLVFPPAPETDPGPAPGGLDGHAAWAALTLPRAEERELGGDRCGRHLVPVADVATFDLVDSLVTLTPHDGRVQILNSTAAHFWDGLRHGEELQDLVTDVVEATSADRHDVERDTSHLRARWREVGMMADADGPDTARAAAPAAARSVLRYASWNGEKVFTVAGTSVAIHLPSWRLDAAATQGLADAVTPGASEAHHRIEVAPHQGQYLVLIDGKPAAPPLPSQALASYCRDSVLALAGQHLDRGGEGVLVHGCALEERGAAVVVLAPTAVRAALMERWLSRGGRVVADGVVPFTAPGIPPLHVGYARPADGTGDPCATADVDPDGQPLMFGSVPHHHRTPSTLPLHTILVIQPTPDPAGRDAELSPAAALLACLAARPRPSSPLDAGSLGAVVRLLSDPHLRFVTVGGCTHTAKTVRVALRLIDEDPPLDPFLP